MFTWILLFVLCLTIFGSAVLVWWRVDKERRLDTLAKGVSVTVETIGAPPTVLVEPLEVKSHVAQWFSAGISRAGEKKGWSQGGFFLLTAGMALAGFMIGIRLMALIGIAAPVIATCVLAAVPFQLRARRRKKVLSLFETQFPDALDFLSRSMRAGNAFSVSLELLAGETIEPLKSEIVRVTREIALGASLEDALNGFAARVPLIEIRFFVSAVLLQRETGGNLSEILGKLAIAVRERLRLRGQVRAASGQGRLTATVLTILPIATLLILNILSPDYIGSLTKDPIGRNLLALATVSQLLGYYFMKKIVNIDV